MRQTVWALMMSSLLVFITSSCNDPTLIVDDLVQDDISNINIVDTFSLRSELLRVDSVITYTPVVTSQSNRFLVGHLVDPYFGEVDASFYFQYVPSEVGVLDSFRFDNITVDSVVLDLVYDSTLTYGDTLNAISLEAFRVVEDISNEVELYSNKSYATDITPLGGVYNFKPNPLTELVSEVDTMTATDGTDSLIYTYIAPRLKMNLDNAFGVELLNQMSVNDSLFFTSERFLEMFKGLQIKAQADTRNFVGFNTQSSSLRVFYTQNGEKESFEFSTGGFEAKTAAYEYDYSTAEIAAIASNPLLGDTLLPLQGLAGLEACVKLPTINTLDEVAINKAVLEMTVAYPASLDTTAFALSERVIVYTESEDGLRVPTQEVILGLNPNAESLFGGTVEQVTEDGMVLDKITMNITSIMQGFADAENAEDNQIFLEIFGHEKDPSRIVIYGANHATYPMKLSVTYTKAE